ACGPLRTVSLPPTATPGAPTVGLTSSAATDTDLAATPTGRPSITPTDTINRLTDTAGPTLTRHPALATATDTAVTKPTITDTPRPTVTDTTPTPPPPTDTYTPDVPTPTDTLEPLTPTDMASPSPADVRITGINFDGLVPRVESDEWAEIANVGQGAADIGGWRLNAGDPGQDFTFPGGFTLQRGQSCRVY